MSGPEGDAEEVLRRVLVVDGGQDGKVVVHPRMTIVDDAVVCGVVGGREFHSLVGLPPETLCGGEVGAVGGWGGCVGWVELVGGVGGVGAVGGVI